MIGYGVLKGLVLDGPKQGEVIETPGNRSFRIPVMQKSRAFSSDPVLDWEETVEEVEYHCVPIIINFFGQELTTAVWSCRYRTMEDITKNYFGCLSDLFGLLATLPVMTPPIVRASMEMVRSYLFYLIRIREPGGETKHWAPVDEAHNLMQAGGERLRDCASFGRPLLCSKTS